MQVLVVLAEARGKVVSRDDLIARCWGGRVVGDDAINRVIGKIRRLSEGAAAGAFELETVTKVGYRLIVRPTNGVSAVAAAPPSVLSRRRLPRARRAAVVLALAIVAVIGFVVLQFTTAAKPVAGARPRPASQPAAPLLAARDLETRGIAAVFEGTPEQTAQGIGYLKAATALSPGYAAGWGSLAMAYVLSFAQTPMSEQATVALRVREAEAQALRLNPHEGHAQAALVSLEPTFLNWRRKDAVLSHALALAPHDTPPLMYQQVQFLTNVGRTGEALALVERLSAIAPLIPWIEATRVDLLVANGRLDEAERVAAHNGQLWPRDRQVWFSRFLLDALNGNPERALAMTADKADWPTQTTAQEIALARRVAEAFATGSASQAAAVLDAYRALAAQGQGYAEMAIPIAAALGRPDEAMHFARRLYLLPTPAGPSSLLTPRIGYARPEERSTAVLFLSPANRVWSDPGFLPLMSQLGLVDYWRATRSPDLCREPRVAALCENQGLSVKRRGERT